MRVAARAALLAATAAALGCAATRPAPPPESDPGCPGSVSPRQAICARDEAVRTLRARFRAEVETPDASRSAEGVLALRAPDALRVKLFTLAGLTVYDAVVVGDAERVRGVVRQPLSGREDVIDLAPGASRVEPEADLVLVLWALWQRRCARSPEPIDGAAARFALDPATSRAVRRETRVDGGVVREEVLVRERGGGATETVVARYAAYACAESPPLPRVIEIEAAAQGWRARVAILEQSVGLELDDGLFEVAPGPGDAHG